MDLSWVPIIVGALAMLALTGSLVFGSKHPTQITVALVFATALTGSTVFSTISWEKDKGEIKTVAGVAAQLAQSGQDNKTGLASLQRAVSKLQEQVDLMLSQQTALSGTTGTSLTFKPDSPWSKLPSTDFCKNFEAACKSVSIGPNGVVVPNTTFKALQEYNASAKADLSAADKWLESSGTNLDAAQAQLKSLSILQQQ